MSAVILPSLQEHGYPLTFPIDSAGAASGEVSDARILLSRQSQRKQSTPTLFDVSAKMYSKQSCTSLSLYWQATDQTIEVEATTQILAQKGQAVQFDGRQELQSGNC